MNKIEWMETWTRIKDRFPNWRPTTTEAEDWCIGLRVYEQETVECAGQQIVKKYSSEKPKLPWFVKECEKRKQMDKMFNAAPEPTWDDLREAFSDERKKTIEKLEAVPIERLREATISVLKKHGNIIKKPSDANVREWKNTLRSMVYCEIFREES